MSSPFFDLSGRVALVTGASRGLGQYFGRALARAGADLIITSRTLDSLRPFQKEIEALGRRAVPVELDVRDHDSIQRMADAAEQAYGKIDILVNNAGCNVRKPALDITWDDWNLVLDTNLRGTFFVAQAIARKMIPRGYGRIINIGSVTSVFGYAGLAPYTRQPRRREAADDEPGGRLGPARHHRELPGARVVPHRAEQGALREQGVGRVHLRPHSGEAAGQAERPRRRGGVSGVGGEPSTSPARRCWSTAAFQPAPRRQPWQRKRVMLLSPRMGQPLPRSRIRLGGCRIERCAAPGTGFNGRDRTGHGIQLTRAHQAYRIQPTRPRRARIPNRDEVRIQPTRLRRVPNSTKRDRTDVPDSTDGRLQQVPDSTDTAAPISYRAVTVRERLPKFRITSQKSERLAVGELDRTADIAHIFFRVIDSRACDRVAMKSGTSTGLSLTNMPSLSDAPHTRPP